ncbi:hypothetical protein K9F62_03230 [Desulfovibrio sp. JY]|nr:hypothetical protein K9F62_03230 [Desulfovibrio sp. JY]
MDKKTHMVPFVVNFSAPIIDAELQMLLLRYEYEDGSMGALGLKFEAIKTLQAALSEVTHRVGGVGRHSLVLLDKDTPAEKIMADALDT